MGEYFSVPEFGRIERAALGPRLERLLHRFDERHAKTSGEWVFDWQHRDYIKAKNWVGVVDMPGLSIEIYPKIYGDDGHPDERRRAHGNLLFMLHHAGRLKVQRREMASLKTKRAPLLEVLIAAFADELLFELGRGLTRSYVAKEENSRFLRGKLVLSEQIKHNAAHQERVFVRYDDFTADQLLNQVLKAAAFRLATRTRIPATQRVLRQCLGHFADVANHQIRLEDFDKIHLDRNTQRFKRLIDFARLVFSRESAGASRGEYNTFSLLFPMETVFEQFIGTIIRRHPDRIGLQGQRVYLQAATQTRWLLRDASGDGSSRLKPDVLVREPGEGTTLILDTKWKHLKPDEQLRNNGVLPGDLYQLYAYSQRYQCSTNVLLYPKVPGVTPKDFTVDGDAAKCVRIALIDLSRDLWTERAEFLSDVSRIVSAA